ncbi:MAG: helix-turn-helix domain-containing protein [Deltaproteobacteria bacterium]|nr:helix-turn-helix domain-containing protein [Deltaproteobacteria bacterium]
MTIKTETQSKPEAENRLLSAEESVILSQIASMEQPHSSRAQALLAINEGTSQAEAGRKAGLTKGQLRYWLGKFRKERLSIFPEEFLNQAQPEDEAPQISAVAPDLEQAAGEDETQPAVEQQEAAPKAKKKTKKAKKTKKEKKQKRVKKTKKKRSKKKKDAKGKSSKKSKKKGKK